MTATTEVTDAPEAVATAPEFQPSPALVELHATATRLEREIKHASVFNPRLRMRLDRAKLAASKRWSAEVLAFETANPETTPDEGDAR